METKTQYAYPVYYCTYNRYSGEINKIPIGEMEAIHYDDIPYHKRNIPYLISYLPFGATMADFMHKFTTAALGLTSDTTYNENELLEAIKDIYYRARRNTNCQNATNCEKVYEQIFHNLRNHIFNKYGILV